MTSVVALAATVYIIKGTNSANNQIPDSAYPQFAHDYNAAVGAPAPLPVTQPEPYFLVSYPAAFFPVAPPDFIFSPTFDESVDAGVASLTSSRPLSSTSSGDVIWGYSQGATIATIYKRQYNAAYPGSGPAPVPPVFVFAANPHRPNGGILARGVMLGTIPLLGVTFSGATPTETAGAPDQITSYDIARQHDIVADAPTNPLNLVADANALMGFFLLHGQYPTADLSTLVDQGTFGDTHYYLIPTSTVPLLMPVESVPLVGPVVAGIFDPLVRVVVESAYDRTTSPGQPTPFNPLYIPGPVTFAENVVTAVPTGFDNGLSSVGVGRPLGTTPVTNPYGVGGPAIEADTQEAAVAPGPSTDTDAPADEPGPARLDRTRAELTQSADSSAENAVPVIRRPIAESRSRPGANPVASSADDILRRTVSTTTGGINSVTSAVKGALSGEAGGAS